MLLFDTVMTNVSAHTHIQHRSEAMAGALIARPPPDALGQRQAPRLRLPRVQLLERPVYILDHPMTGRRLVLLPAGIPTYTRCTPCPKSRGIAPPCRTKTSSSRTGCVSCSSLSLFEFHHCQCVSWLLPTHLPTDTELLLKMRLPDEHRADCECIYDALHDLTVQPSSHPGMVSFIDSIHKTRQHFVSILDLGNYERVYVPVTSSTELGVFLETVGRTPMSSRRGRGVQVPQLPRGTHAGLVNREWLHIHRRRDELGYDCEWGGDVQGPL